MSEPVQLAIIAVIASLLTGTIVVAVGVWADGRRKRSEASVATQANEHNELVKVRMEYRDRIEKLEKRLDEKDTELRGLSKELSDARVIVAQQAVKIAELEADLAEVRQERLQMQRDRIEATGIDTNNRLRRGEIGQGERAVVDRAQATEIQVTGEDTNRRVRENQEPTP